MHEPREPMGPAVARERHEATVGMHPGDLVGWGAIWAGFIAFMGVLILLSLLGAGIGLGDPQAVGTTVAGIWGAIVLLVAAFIGGWISGLTSSLKGGGIGALHGAMVWGLVLVISLVLTAFGVAGVLGVLADFGVVLSPQVDPLTAQPVVWGMLVALVISLLAAVFGGALGGSQEWPHEHAVH